MSAFIVVYPLYLWVISDIFYQCSLLPTFVFNISTDDLTVVRVTDMSRLGVIAMIAPIG
ncbi:hypothetical protein BD779DRAFT_1490389 [Infundibulicybe gibba]|nr:hypothetical protein BD779DRAFT_1490389 [Infundibulicybe gibba]